MVVGNENATYLDGVPGDVAGRLAEANRVGLAALRRYLESGEAVAFLGAGTSAPLYPLWPTLVGDLIDAAVERGMAESMAATCRAEAAGRPDAVVEIVSRHLGGVAYQGLLRELFQVRRDPQSGRTWTPVHELVCRCAFKALVTTNYDPGIVDARMRVRPRAVSTGFATWQDELRLDDWRTGDVFSGVDELPVLFAHGHHNQPDGIVLATTDYRRAYAGKLAAVIARMVDAWHLVWLGFSFADQRIGAILREVREQTGTRGQPGAPPRHVAVMAYDPADTRDPATLVELARIEYGADLVLYPAPDGDHSALHRLLAGYVDTRYSPAPMQPAPTPPSAGAVPVAWAQGSEPERPFVRRAEELSKLDRWAADPTVRVIGVTAWGGAGKTALVTHWLNNAGGAERRAGVRGVFGWSFYADPSAETWAKAVLDWARDTLHVRVDGPDLATRIFFLLRVVPVVLVLDGLEVVQEGPTSTGRGFGRLLDGPLRHVLTAAARLAHPSLVVLTSRFPFADLAGFDGGSARMLELPPFTPAEGAALLTAAGVSGLGEQQLHRLARAVDGHALALSALAALLTSRPEHTPPATVADLLTHLDQAGSTGRKVTRLLEFYSQRLDQQQRLLVAAVGLFTRPISAAQLLALAEHDSFQPLASWDEAMVRAAVRGPLAGLLSWHTDHTITAHPLVRQVFRPLALGAAQIAVDAALAGTPTGAVTDRDQAIRLVEAIELLLDADQWTAADNLYIARTDNGQIWQNLPAAQLGQRAATAFVATSQRQQDCISHLAHDRPGFYLNEVGVSAMYAGDLTAAIEYLPASIDYDRGTNALSPLTATLQNWSECLANLGRVQEAADAAAEAFTLAVATENRTEIEYAHVYRGAVAHLAGDTDIAEQQFRLADLIDHTDDQNGGHVHSGLGAWWGQFLHDTGRAKVARQLTEANLTICRLQGWGGNAARCQMLLARIDITTGDPAAAKPNLDAALATFRTGDHLIDLAEGLVVAGELARRAGDHENANQHLDEAINIAGPRGLTPIHIRALSARARVCADRFTGTNHAMHLFRGRDAAEAALRLATGPGPLPWAELDACEAHAHLDRAEGIDRGWAARADALRRRLVPAGLDPDPLASVEAEVARQKKAGG
jgi:tetratricopeptide (TPR) repeat protein